MKRVAVLVLGLALAAATATGGGDVVEDVIDAARKKDDAALHVIEAKVDAWVMLDALLTRGQHDVASAWLAVVSEAERPAMTTYAERGRAAPPSAEAARLLKAFDERVIAKDRAGAVASLEGKEPDASGSVQAVRLARAKAMVLADLARREEASAAYLRAAVGARALGWRGAAHESYREAGAEAYRAGDAARAREIFSTWLAFAVETTHLPMEMQAHNNLGVMSRALGDFPAALDHYGRALALAEAIGDRKWVGGSHNNIGVVHLSTGDFRGALAAFERAAAVKATLPDAADHALTLGNIGVCHQHLGDLDAAFEAHRRALVVMEAANEQPGVARALGNLAELHRRRGELPESLGAMERALGINRSLGLRVPAAQNVASIAQVHVALGEHEAALARGREALAAFETAGEPMLRAKAMLSLSATLSRVGRVAEALDLDRRAQTLAREAGARPILVDALAAEAQKRVAIGEDEAALALLSEALPVAEAMGSPDSVAYVHSEIAIVLSSLGRLDESRASFDRSLSILPRDRPEHRARRMHVHDGLGRLHLKRGAHDDAVRELTASIALARALGEPWMGASAYVALGAVERKRGDPKAAVAALSTAAELGDAMPAVRSDALAELAVVRLEQGDAPEAVRLAREAVAGAWQTRRSLAEEESATAGEKAGDAFDVGTAAALAANDVDSLFFFLEAGRGHALLETLRARESVREAVVPADLVRPLGVAEAKEATARAAYLEAMRSGRRDAIRAAKEVLGVAVGNVETVVKDVQRRNRVGASLVRPEPETLAATRARLAPDEALAIYGAHDERAFALVVTAAGAHVRDLGPPDALLAACDRARLVEAPHVDPAALDALRRLLVEPLALAPTIRRVVVSPVERIAYVPFCALLGERDVSYAPSASVVGALASDRTAPGQGVLALADPDYPATGGADARGGPLARLPSTRDEAKAVGDVLLLGERATEAELKKALGTRPRWRAIHLACHGLVDAERPLQSSLALTPTATDDGRLTCLEVFRLRAPADLAVLSACETARGKVFRSEGIVGLARAFLCAGTSRVIASLWKVDDAATAALMKRFYASWKAGKGAAAALRDAQRHVALDPRWSHPTYWAAWQLWGPGD